MSECSWLIWVTLKLHFKFQFSFHFKPQNFQSRNVLQPNFVGNSKVYSFFCFFFSRFSDKSYRSYDINCYYYSAHWQFVQLCERDTCPDRLKRRCFEYAPRTTHSMLLTSAIYSFRFQRQPASSAAKRGLSPQTLYFQETTRSSYSKKNHMNSIWK